VQPLILIDVDGVLNIYPRRASQLGTPWIDAKCRVAGWSLRVTLNPDHGPMLLALAEKHDAQLVWATTWERDANREISPLVGLPTDLPVIGVERDRQMLGSPVPGVMRKVPYVADYVGGRPFVWFDDDLSPRDGEYLADHAGPHCLITVDDWDGLTLADIEQADEWLTELAGGAR
jgi:hypothetical protein